MDLKHFWISFWFVYLTFPPVHSHTGHMSLHMVNTVLGIPLPLLDVHVESDQIGPSIVLLRFKIFLGRGVWIQTVVPEEPLYQRMTNYVFADWWIPTFAITAFLKVIMHGGCGGLLDGGENCVHDYLLPRILIAL